MRLFHREEGLLKSCDNIHCQNHLSQNYACTEIQEPESKIFCFSATGKMIEEVERPMMFKVLNHFFVVQYPKGSYAIYHYYFGLITRTLNPFRILEATEEKISVLKELSPTYRELWTLDSAGGESTVPQN